MHSGLHRSVSIARLPSNAGCSVRMRRFLTVGSIRWHLLIPDLPL